MATITYGAVPASQADRTDKPGFWSRLAARLIEARSREADRRVREQLLGFDAVSLARLGYDRDALIKAGLRDYF